ncbi:sulfurtransferase [Streptomyces sp. NPDC058665]|uniref:sulfurtransferase n=1 Tax=Streptomyces sp. NPDC058665 TaxID=3346586 RepID=UPI003656C2BF
MTVIISASALADEIAGPRPPALLDVRYVPGAPPGRPEYDAGHLPGAVFVDLEAELSGPPGAGGRHPLPDVAAFGAVMRRAGVSAGTPVVVYDGGQGWAAARAWWMLRWTGHQDVRVLDGGLAGWDGPLTTEIPTPGEGDFSPVPDSLPLLDADGAAALARDGLLLDARAAERYRGDVEPLDRVGGHIPGAVSAPTAENVGPDGRFLPADELAGRFRALGAKGDGTGPEVGVYCGSGVSAAHELVALEIAGIPAALYAGSWSEWTADPERPVATGPDPQ